MEKKTILVVDDDPIIALFLKILFENIGFKVVTEMKSIEDAIEFIKILNPVLVILDINLNLNKDGIDIGKFLLEFDKIPYIYITGSFDTITVNRIKETRPYGYFSKPFNPDDLIISVKIILDNYKHRHVDIVRKNFDNDNVITESPLVIKNTIKYINDNIYNLIEIDQLVLLTHWDKHHFLRMFTKFTGVTPYQYILQQKMNIAMGFLLETDLNIVEIAYDLGFNSHSNFSVRFKKMIGVTPDEFRKINKTKKWLNS